MSLSLHGTPQSTYPGNAQTGVVVTAGDLIIVGYSYNNTNQSPTCTDNASGGTNTYNQVGTGQAGPGADTATYGHVFYAVAKASETLAVTCTPETDGGIHVHVVSGNNQTLASVLGHFNSSAESGATRTAHTSASITTDAGDTNAYLFVFWFQESYYPTTLAENGTGFTIRTDQQGHVSHTFDQIVSAQGTYNDATTSGVSSRYANIIVSFKAAAAGGGTPTPRRRPIFILEGKHVLPMALIGALIRNPKMTRREMLGKLAIGGRR